MTGLEYEQFVRAVLCQRLGFNSDVLRSLRTSGVTLPGGTGLNHQIDLVYVNETEIAKYVTIIECKFRSADLVDQQELQNLAFVKESVRAHKAIMVTNKGFTAGAKAVAESQGIALLIIEPADPIVLNAAGDDVDSVFAMAQDYLRRKSANGYNITVTRRLVSDPNSSAFDELLSNPEIRDIAEKLMTSPGVREQARHIAETNPDLARKALDFLGKRNW